MNHNDDIFSVTKDVGDEMCWLQLEDVGDDHDRFVTNINLPHGTLASGTNIQKTEFGHQSPLIVNYIKKPTSRCHQHQCSHFRLVFFYPIDLF